MASVGEVLQRLLQRAPQALAESWDNVGLLVGDAAQPVSGILVCLDLTPAALEAARQAQANLVITHHPLFTTPLAAFTADCAPAAWAAARQGLSVICMHTNLDAAPGGLADQAAALLGLTDTRPLIEAAPGALQKLVVFVPETHREQVLAALAEAGAGVIGKYDYCSFSTSGTGTFRALPGAQPFLGTVGQVEQAAEVRLETVVPKALARRAVQAMLAAHPYQEVAFDLYTLHNAWPGAGLGRVGTLPAPMAGAAFAQHVAGVFGGPVQVAGEKDQVCRVAVLPGGGGKAVVEAAQAGADALVTGDVGHHDALAAHQHGLLLVGAGHYHTELPAVGLLAEWCREAAPQVPVTPYLDTSPWSGG